MVANCFEKIRISSTFTFFFPEKSEDNPPPFLALAFPSAFFFLDLIRFVIITFCSLSL